MIKEVKRIVVKVGTSSLTYHTGKLNIRRIRKLGEVQIKIDRKSTRLNSSHIATSRMPSSA